MRVLRLLIGLFIVGQAVVAHDAVLGLLGGVFSLMALLNTGCCGSGTCMTVPENRSADKKDIHYEEVV